MLKPLIAIAAAMLLATNASAATIIVPLGVVVVPPTQTTSPGVTFATNGANSAYYEFTISQPGTMGVSSFTNSAIGNTGVFNFSSIDLYSGTGIDGMLLQTGAISARLGGTQIAFLDPYTFSAGSYTIAYTGKTIGAPASVGSSITFAAGAVPEVSTWAMMLAGFGMIGFAARRRSNVKTAVAYV